DVTANACDIGAVGGEPRRNRDLGGDGFVRATLYKPDHGGADRADANGVLCCARVVRHRAWYDAAIHPSIQRTNRSSHTANRAAHGTFSDLIEPGVCLRYASDF